MNKSIHFNLDYQTVEVMLRAVKETQMLM